MKECETIIQKALREERFSLLPSEAQQIGIFHNIPLPESYIASNVNEAAAEAKKIGYPVALKIVSPTILHKSDAGGVALNISDDQELRLQYEKMTYQVAKREPTAKILGVMVQEMIPPSTEVIIGAIKDSQFGPSIMFGIGGIFTEIYNDVAFRVAPIDRIDARNLIHSLKGSRILEGTRGKPTADIEALAKMLVNVSNLVTEHNAISQLDLNPVMAYSNSVCAVDFKIILNKKAKEE